MNKLLVVCFCVLLVSACRAPDDEPVYRYKTKTYNTPYTFAKKDKQAAEKTARKELKIEMKSACRSFGTGWYLKETKSEGTLSCKETPEGHRCRFDNVILECRQLDERF